MAITNAQRQYVRSLRQLKARRKYGTFTVEGLTNLAEVLNSPLNVQDVYGTTAALERLPMGQRLRRLYEAGHVHEVGEAELGRLSEQRSPHGAVAVVHQRGSNQQVLAKASSILYLDGISDPGNLGTILRTAEWFGIDVVVASPNSVDWYNPKVVAAARGSLFRSLHLRLEAEKMLDVLGSEVQVAVLDLDGMPVADVRWAARTVLCIGNESHGPSDALRKLSPKLVTIPRAANSQTESLNAGVACAIACAFWKGK